MRYCSCSSCCPSLDSLRLTEYDQESPKYHLLATCSSAPADSSIHLHNGVEQGVLQVMVVTVLMLTVTESVMMG